MSGATRGAVPKPDADLAAAAGRARSGEKDGFRELIELTSPRIYRLALRVLRDPDEADDVVQETYIRAWNRIEELRDPAAAVGWLSRIARNAARDRLRWWKRRRREPFDEAAALAGQMTDQVRTPDQELVSAETGAAIARAVSALPDRQRVVLLLREVDGMTYEEIAEALDVPVGTVESRLHRARAALARRLAREEAR